MNHVTSAFRSFYGSQWEDRNSLSIGLGQKGSAALHIQLEKTSKRFSSNNQLLCENYKVF